MERLLPDEKKEFIYKYILTFYFPLLLTETDRMPVVWCSYFSVIHAQVNNRIPLVCVNMIQGITKVISWNEEMTNNILRCHGNRSEARGYVYPGYIFRHITVCTLV